MTLWILFVIAALFQQPPTGTVRGRVTAAGSGQPVANAKVEVSLEGKADREGRFEIAGLEPGRRLISVSAPGYVDHSARVRINAGQITTLNIELQPLASVSGRITDDDDQPFAGILVHILKAVYDFDGRRSLQEVRSAYTDDRGAYRIFWIPPGRYYVAAGFGDEPRRTVNEVRGERVIGVYYPRTPDAAQASTIELKPAAEVIGIDFSFRRLRTHAISGRVVDAATGKPPVSPDVSVRQGGTYDPRTGTFKVWEVDPGLRVIRANVNEPVPPGGYRTAAEGKATVLIDNADVEGVLITVAAPPEIRGRLIVEGETGSLKGAILRLTPLDADSSHVWGDVDPEGTFSLEAPPGQYRVHVDTREGGWSHPRNAYIKEARFNFADALNRPVTVTAEEGSTLSVVLSPNGARLEGTVLDERLQPVADATVALIPNRRDRLDLYRQIVTDENGRFRLEGISPGDYKAFAWTRLELNTHFDPDLTRKHEQQGQPLHFLELSQVSVQLRVIP